MCGRFTLRTPMTVLMEEFQVGVVSEQPFLSRFNVAPTQDIPVVRETDAGRELTWMRWGFIPPWAKDAKSGPLLLNARSETAAEKPAFRSAFKSTRCIVPADGFYEWKNNPARNSHTISVVPMGDHLASPGCGANGGISNRARFSPPMQMSW